MWFMRFLVMQDIGRYFFVSGLTIKMSLTKFKGVCGFCVTSIAGRLIGIALAIVVVVVVGSGDAIVSVVV